MRVIVQILVGSGVLLVCTIVHVAILLRLIAFLRRRASQRRPGESFRADFAHVIVPVLIIVVSHMVQIYIWAMALDAFGALDGYERSIYFALTTYTTLGYGDLVLTPGYQIFGAIAAVTGIINFGISTAFIVGYFARALRLHGDD